MKLIFILFALVCAATIARADLVMQQQITVSTNNSIATMKVKGAKVRLDLYAGQPRAISTITDLKTGDAITLLHNQKMFVKTSGAPTKQTKPSGNGANTNTAPKPPVPQATGKTEKVGGYNTEIYTWSNSRGITGTAWVAKNYPDYARIQTDLALLDKAAADANNTQNPELSKLPGMVVRSQVAGGKQTITVTLVSAREESMDASLFQIPAGYKEMPQPKPFVRPAPKVAPGNTAPGK
ncbi:MAG: DUF4412 domain-containing protein [Verrucomicrobiia bacterium]